jgi:hypothetical protein
MPQIAQPYRAVTPITPEHATHKDILALWDHGAARLAPSRRRIVLCRAIRRGLMSVKIPPLWLQANGIESGWLESAVPERWLLDLNLSNTLGEQEISYERTPLGTTDTAHEDADNLEAWVNSVERDPRGGTDHDAMVGLAIQDGEWASLVLPTVADMRKPPSYMDEQTAKNGTRVLTPKARYHRDSQQRPPDHPKYGGRSERHSRAAYDDAYEAWMARNHPWTTRLVSATDCVPIMTRGMGRSRWACTGLIIRTLYDVEDLIDRDWQWQDMHKGELIPREHGTDSNYGDGGRVYVYEWYTTTKSGKPFIAYCVGGNETWWTEDGGKKERAAVIDLDGTYGIDEPVWDYHYGLHFEDDPAYRGMPYLWPEVPTLLNLEALRTAINGAAWSNSFTGHVVRPDPNVPPSAYLDGGGQFRPQTAPRPGELKPAYGEVAPFQQAHVGEDAYKSLAMMKQDLASSTPDAGQTGGDTGDKSGHALVVGQSLLSASKRQIKQGILGCGTSIVYRKLMIADTFHRERPGERQIDWPVFIRKEEIVPTGEAKTHYTTLGLKERWLSGNYWMEASFPEQGNLAEIALARDLALAGFATDEDVFKARGIKSAIIERAKIANYKWLNSPEGQMELQLRAAQYRGDLQKQKLLAAVAAQKASPGGTPMAAAGAGGGQSAPPAPTGAGQPGPGRPGSTTLPNTAEASLNGSVQGQMGIAARTNDAQAQMQIGG